MPWIAQCRNCTCGLRQVTRRGKTAWMLDCNATERDWRSTKNNKTGKASIDCVSLVLFQYQIKTFRSLYLR